MTTMLPPNVKVHLALGFIDMRKGIDGLAMLVQGVLHQDPFLCVGRGYVARHISFHGVSVRVPRAHPGQPDQDHLLRWHRLLSLHQLPQWYARSGPAALNVELL